MGAYKRIVLLVFALLIAVGSGLVLAAGNDNNIEWDGLGHDSRDSLYRSPTGAVTTGTPIRLRLRAYDNDLTAASVRVWNDRLNTSTNYSMSLVAENVLFAGDSNAYEFWEVTLPASAEPTVYWYRFIAYDGTDTNYYEDDSSRTGGWGQVFDSSPDNSWQLTIYDAAFSTPSWVQNAVIYQIFPDRFRDGDSSNNPAAGEFFYGNYDTIYRSNNTDWNAPICDPRVRPGSSFTCNGAYSQNFYGGDLQGIIDELDYLDSLGITALYLNPIFESPSNHKYDTTDFFHIDDNFGDLATFQTLVAEANSRGINIILDGVFNHSSSDSVYFDRYSRWTGTSSPAAFPTSTVVGFDDDSGACESNSTGYTLWYTFFNYTGSGASPCSDNRDYPKWFGIFDSLPVFQHDYSEVRDYFINNGTSSVAPYWIAQGADGWRLDVAPEIDHGQINDPSDDYWEDFRNAVHSINSDTYIVGEEWGNPTSWTIGDEWDATMNYQQSAAILSFWRDSTFTDNDFNGGSSAGTLNPLSPDGLNERFLNLEERYASPAFYAMMNLFGSHDTNRALFLLDHNAGGNNTALYNDPNYDWSDSITRLQGAALIQMTMPGAPTIYYGDEIGLVGPVAYDGSQWQDDPYNRQPYPWLDETGSPYYAHLQDTTARNDLFSYYQLLIDTRMSYPALRTGSFDPLLTASEVYAYGRKMDDDSSAAVILVNSSGSSQAATVNVSGYIPAGAILVDALTGTPYTVNSASEISATVPAQGGILLVMNAFSGRPACAVSLVAVGASGQVNLSWSSVANATSYDVYRSRLSDGGYDLIGNTSSTNYSDTTVSNATTYYYTLVAKNDTSLLTSRDGDNIFCGNEVSATPALSIGWHVLQWPPTLTHTLNATIPTENIYGQIYIAGSTDAQNTVVAGVLAEVGYGAVDSTPDDSWTWFAMTPNASYNFSQNNDEYQGTLLPTSAGTFWYTVRWSTDGGLSWRYSQMSPGGDYTSGNVGVLTVNASADTTAPDAPLNLSVLSTTTGSVTLGWDSHPNTDGDLYGFRVYRENTASPGYSLIATVTNAAAVQYVDGTVTSGANYNYYITAYDTSLNESAASNVVNTTAEQRMVSVTFTVTVPDATPGTVYIVGSFNSWNPNDPAYALTQTGANTWEITFDILDESFIDYKYTRGSWERVEKDADGNAEISNRVLTAAYGTTGTQSRNDTVANWRDPFVVSHTPLDGALDVDPNTTISLVWNQDVPASANITVNNSGGAVAGTWTFDGGTNTSTFTPSAALADDTYTVVASGISDVAGDGQQVSESFSFVVGEGLPTTVNVTFSVTVPGHTPSPVYIVGNFGDFSGSTYPSWNPAGILMTETSPDVWEVTIPNVPLGFSFQYKYTRGSWETVEKEADGNTEILGGGNRSLTSAGIGTQTQNDTVANWRDPYVISVSPADASTGNAPSTVVVIGWNQDMPSSLTSFTVLDSGSNPVAGTVSYDSGTDSHTFTPAAALGNGSYSVAASGNSDVNSDAQGIAFSSTFEVSSVSYNLTDSGNVWFNLQWPPTISYTVSASPTENIYGQIWINGVTGSQNGVDPTSALIAQIGYGADGTLPTDPSWQWFSTSFNTNVGNNDEFVGTLHPTVAGNYDYLYRYSGDGGTTWVYGATNGPYYNLSGYNPANAGQLTVSPSTDTTAPDAPTNLTVTGEASNQVDLGWDAHPNTDGDLNAFEIYRDGVLIDTILDPSATSYSDTTVAPSTSYDYYIVAVDSSLNESAASNTVTANTPANTISLVSGSSWFNLQWPPTISYTISASPTENIYGQIWVNGLTGSQNGVDPTPGLIAQIGYGADGTLPTDPSWQWFSTSFNTNVGNNDEFVGTLQPTVAGNYDYLYRYSGDGGATWVYGGLTGPYYDLSGYNPANAGQLTVSPGADTTAPDAPANLVVVAETSTQIDLAWDAHPNTDGDLASFEIYRDGVLIDTVTNLAATSYSDTTVVAGTTYDYYIVAVDSSDNASAASNTVTATAPAITGVTVTFRVTVPAHTPASSTVYLMGNFPAPYPNWDAAGIPMTLISSSATNGDLWEVTLDLPDATSFEYKYTRGSLETIEKAANGNTDILGGANRSFTASTGLVISDTVANWRDPYIILTRPADGQTNVRADANIRLTWNQAMPSNISAYVTILKPNGLPLAGRWTYNSNSRTHIFNPNPLFRRGIYTVDVSGAIDVNGDVQQVDTFISFRSDRGTISHSIAQVNTAIQENSAVQETEIDSALLSMNFAANDNFVSRGDSNTIELRFQNPGEESLSGTLELIFPLGISASNASSSHGTPTSFEQYLRGFGTRHMGRNPQNIEQQGNLVATGLRLDFYNLAFNETVTMSALATVDARFAGQSATIEARLKIDGEEIDATSVLLVVDNSLLALPATGETPFWYWIGLAFVGLTVTCLLVGAGLLRRKN